MKVRMVPFATLVQSLALSRVMVESGVKRPDTSTTVPTSIVQSVRSVKPGPPSPTTMSSSQFPPLPRIRPKWLSLAVVPVASAAKVPPRR